MNYKKEIIRDFKKDKNAIILAHNYQTGIYRKLLTLSVTH